MVLLSRLASTLAGLWSPPAAHPLVDAQRVLLTHRIVMVLLLGEGVVLALSSLSPGTTFSAIAVAHGPLLLVVAACLFLLKQGRAVLAGWVLSLSLWAFVTMIVWLFGGLMANNGVAYVLAVMVAGTTVGLRASLVVSLLSILAAGFAVRAELDGTLPPPMTPLTNINAWIAITVTVVLTSLLHDLAVLARDRALALADENLSRLRRTQAENEMRTLHGREIGRLGQRAIDVGEPRPFCVEALDVIRDVAGDTRSAVFLTTQGKLAPFVRHGGLPGELPPLPDETEVLARSLRNGLGSALGREVPALATVLGATPEELIVGVPLGTPRHAFGWLCVVHQAPDLSPDEALFISTVAGMVGSALQRDRAENRLLHAQKLEVVGRLAGGVAHDFNNILTVMMSVSGGLRDAVDDAERTRLLDTLDASMDRAVLVTRQLLAFTRRQAVVPELLPVDEVLEALDPLLRRVLRDDVLLSVEGKADGARVLIDRGNLEQVLLNLVINARDAMPSGGRLTIRTRRDAGHVELAIEDTGLGMDETTRLSVFQPFFSTRPDGTGLGLAIVDDIVRRHGGTISLDSTPGKGTRFVIRLPEGAGERPTGASSPWTAVPKTRSARILLAEDNDGVRENVRRMLVSAGHEVVAVVSGREALAVADADPSFDLVLTDLSMPELGGLELARTLQQRGLELPVIFMSGYAEQLPDDARPGHFLQKPFTLRTLLEAVALRLPAREATAPGVAAVG